MAEIPNFWCTPIIYIHNVFVVIRNKPYFLIFWGPLLIILKKNVINSAVVIRKEKGKESMVD